MPIKVIPTQTVTILPYNHVDNTDPPFDQVMLNEIQNRMKVSTFRLLRNGTIATAIAANLNGIKIPETFVGIGGLFLSGALLTKTGLQTATVVLFPQKKDELIRLIFYSIFSLSTIFLADTLLSRYSPYQSDYTLGITCGLILTTIGLIEALWQPILCRDDTKLCQKHSMEF